MGVCMSYVSTIHLVDSLGASFDSALVEWKEEAETKMELVQVIFFARPSMSSLHLKK